MTVTEVLALIAAGVVAGVFSTVAGLASVVSYPALLAVGLSPLSANMTNTVALLFTGVGAAAGSREELAGQGTALRRLGPVAALGGAAGAAVLLLTPARAFEVIAPLLIAGASALLLLRPERGHELRAGPGERSLVLLAAVFGVAVYTGYFGAAGGIITLAVLTATLHQAIARNNALKNVLGGLANAVAAVAFALFGPVRWAAVLPLAVGFLAGGWLGPALVRRMPGRLIRILVGVAGLAVAVKLGISAYG